MNCKICRNKTAFVGTKIGKFKPCEYHLFQCQHCYFSFIQNPDTDYAEIYSEAYYHNKGADPLIDYVYEIDNPIRTIRTYEWQGILKIVRLLISLTKDTRWLDFGCGNGGLVRFCRENSPADVVGFEEGWGKEKAIQAGIPVVESIASMEQQFDVVTAIEVLEHVENPLQTLKAIRKLLKPGGLFFYTTGNAHPFRNRLMNWSYIVPEIHISLFEPKSLETALHMTGFSTEYKKFIPGFDDVIRYKVLKNLRARDKNWLEKIVPWPVIVRLVDKIYQVSAHPIAWAKF